LFMNYKPKKKKYRKNGLRIGRGVDCLVFGFFKVVNHITRTIGH